MSCSALYVANTTSQAVGEGEVINFGSVVRKYGCNLGISGGNVELKGCGYYNVDINVTLAPSATGTGTMQLLKDGVAVTGAKVVKTVTGGAQYTFTIPAIVRQRCDCVSVLTVVVDSACTVSNAAMVATKL